MSKKYKKEIKNKKNIGSIEIQVLPPKHNIIIECVTPEIPIRVIDAEAKSIQVIKKNTPANVNIQIEQCKSRSEIKIKVEQFLKYLYGNKYNTNEPILENPEDAAKIIDQLTNYFYNDLKLENLVFLNIKANETQKILFKSFKNLFKEFHPTKFYPESLYEVFRRCFYKYRSTSTEILKKIGN